MKQVTVYSKPNCMQCEFTKQFLDQNNISYVARDVIADESAMEQVKELGFTSLPVVVIDGMEPFSGFRPDQLEKLIA